MRTAFVLLPGLSLLVLLGIAAKRTAAPAIEAKLATAVGQQLSEAGLPQHLVSIDGRDVWVDTASAVDEPGVQRKVVQALLDVSGLREIHVRDSDERVSARLEAKWNGSTLRLSGILEGEGTERERSDLSDDLRRSLGNATIINEIALDPDVERPGWVGEVQGLLRIVWGDVRDGTLTIDGLVISVTGTVANENVRTEVGERLAALMPGYSVRNQISVPGGQNEVRAGIAEILAKGSVEFAEGTNQLTEGSQDLLDEMADLLIAHPDVAIRIQGYFSTGRPSEELPLSRVRAIVVGDYLLGRGVLASRVNALGMGAPANAGVSEDQGVQSLVLFFVEEGV